MSNEFVHESKIEHSVIYLIISWVFIQNLQLRIYRVHTKKGGLGIYYTIEHEWDGGSQRSRMHLKPRRR